MLLKICCIATIAEAELAIRHGAHAVGLVSAMPSGPGPIPDATIGEIARAVAGRVRTFLLTSRVAAEPIAEQVRAAGVTTVQLVDHVPHDELRRLRRALPGIGLVQVIHVIGPESADEARAAAPLVDALLLDSGDPRKAVKELGGTGRVHDWATSRRIVETAGRPVWLAGGLKAENVAQAMEAVGPHGLDICSGVRLEGRLDEERLARYVAAVRQLPQGR